LTLKQLEAVHAILKAGTVSAAARSLHLTQPAISAVLKHTEQNLGMRLFERRAGRLYPTPEALALLPDLEHIFASIDGISRLADALKDGHAGKVVVATTPTLGLVFLPQAVADLRITSPTIEVVIHTLPVPMVSDRVSRREADFGLTYGIVDDASLDTEVLCAKEIHCVVKRGHRLARKKEIHFNDLEGESIISTGSFTHLGTLIERTCDLAGLARPRVRTAVSALTACAMVKSGAGAALVDGFISHCGLFDDLAFIPLRPKVEIVVQLLFPCDRPRSRASMMLIEQIKANLALVE